MDIWRKDWAAKKCDTALRLSGGECGGSYGEGVIIICASISALAAEVWPGIKKDRVRFVELLKEFSPSEFDTTRISVPLLIDDLRNKKHLYQAKKLEKSFLDFVPGQVLIGSKVDKFENEIIGLCPRLSLNEVRKFSYANLLYGQVRSSYAHEYRPGQLANSWPMTSDQSSPASYVEWFDKPIRRIHFHIPWLVKIAVTLADSIDAVSTTLPRVDPAKWWVEG